jgi:hypothetical protein
MAPMIHGPVTTADRSTLQASLPLTDMAICVAILRVFLKKSNVDDITSSWLASHTAQVRRQFILQRHHST